MRPALGDRGPGRRRGTSGRSSVLAHGGALRSRRAGNSPRASAARRTARRIGGAWGPLCSGSAGRYAVGSPRVKPGRRRYALGGRVGRVKLGSGLESCSPRAGHNSRPDPVAWSRLNQAAPAEGALIQTARSPAAGIGYHSGAIRRKTGTPMADVRGAERLPDRWDDAEGGGDERAGAAALPLEPARRGPSHHELRRGQHLGQGDAEGPADRAGRDRAVGEGLGRGPRVHEEGRLRDALPRQARVAEGPLPRPRARGRDGGVPARTAPSTSTPAPRRSTRRCTPSSRRRTSTTCTPTR